MFLKFFVKLDLGVDYQRHEPESGAFLNYGRFSESPKRRTLIKELYRGIASHSPSINLEIKIKTIWDYLL